MYGLQLRRVIMCLKGSVAEHSPSKTEKPRSFVTAPRGAGPRRQVKSTLQRDNYLPRETKHLLLSMYRHQGNMLEILSTSNTWRVPHAAPLASVPAAVSFEICPSPRPGFHAPAAARRPADCRRAALSAARSVRSITSAAFFSFPLKLFCFPYLLVIQGVLRERRRSSRSESKVSRVPVRGPVAL